VQPHCRKQRAHTSSPGRNGGSGGVRCVLRADRCKLVVVCCAVADARSEHAGYLGGPKLGARIYNAIHSYVTPATLAVVGLLLGSQVLLPYALIWMNHIGVDRLLGYGLKYPQGFRFTHLGKLTGKRVDAIPAAQNPA